MNALSASARTSLFRSPISRVPELGRASMATLVQPAQPVTLYVNKVSFAFCTCVGGFYNMLVVALPVFASSLVGFGALQGGLPAIHHRPI